MRLQNLKSNDETVGVWLVLIVILLIGASMRLFFIFRSDFPLNDGGMFHTMVRDVQANRYSFPIVTSYNHAEIPFAYPPLPFYFAAILEDFAKLDLFDIQRFFPVILNIITILAFYFLSLEILDSKFQALQATLAFSIVSPSFEWLIMGGGLTRSPAYFFSILTIQQGIRMLKTHKLGPTLWATLLAGLTGYCHIEILYTTGIFLTIAFWFLSRNRYGLLSLLYLGVGTGFLMSPYFIFIMRTHGLQPYFSAMGAGEFNWANSIGKLLLNNITGEYLITPILVIAIIAFGRNLSEKDYLLPAWVLATVLLNPRSMERSIIIPLCILTGIGFDQIIIPGITKAKISLQTIKESGQRNGYANNKSTMFPSFISMLIVSYLILRAASTVQLFLLDMQSLSSLPKEDQQAMQWIDENTREDSSFLVLTPPMIWELNNRSEWFPTITNRKSITTVQGSEWLPENRFAQQEMIYEAYAECIVEGLVCTREISQQEKLDFTHIYLSGELEDKRAGVSFPFPIETELRNSHEFKIVYDVKGVLIFQATQQ